MRNIVCGCLQVVSEHGAGSEDDDSGHAWAALWQAVVKTFWYLSFLVLPACTFAVGVSAPDLLHGTYLLMLVLAFVGTTARLAPSVSLVCCPLACLRFA